jgi:geranylgeranyl diphosphate synthase, type I
MTKTIRSATDGMKGVQQLSEQIGSVLGAFLATRRAEVATIDATLPPLVDELQAVIESGGKRIRPWLACWGYRAAGQEVGGSMLAAAASLELIHTFALLQDDIMDGSATRRGRPATHITMGSAAALLISDLALVWADQLLTEADLPADRLAEGMRVVNALRSEVTLGQYLDVAGPPDEEHALKVDLYKTASYTVLRPIQLGMVLGGAHRGLVDSVPAYAEPAGIAFQLRDDVLGAFGDSAVTGKPAGDDLQGRKATWLWARALRLGGEPPAGLEEMRDWIRRSGALADTEALITRLEREAREALRRMPVKPHLREELEHMTDSLVNRSA